MYHADYRLSDPRLVQAMVEAFPFATLMVNGPHCPMVAQAPCIFHADTDGPGFLEFHLAAINPCSVLLEAQTGITVLFQGPSAAISPMWYKGRFPEPDSDRSRAAPTWNYLSLVLTGHLELLTPDEIRHHMHDLVSRHEPEPGWDFAMMDPDLYQTWSGLIKGYRFRTETADLTAKLSQDKLPADRAGVIEGLKTRNGYGDALLASLMEPDNTRLTTLYDKLVTGRSDEKTDH